MELCLSVSPGDLTRAEQKILDYIKIPVPDQPNGHRVHPKLHEAGAEKGFLRGTCLSEY